MDQRKKLLVIIEHWIEHNESHAEEYKRWAQTAQEMGIHQVKEEIELAMEKIVRSNEHLKKALNYMTS